MYHCHTVLQLYITHIVISQLFSYSYISYSHTVIYVVFHISDQTFSGRTVNGWLTLLRLRQRSETNAGQRQLRWGAKPFVERVKRELGIHALHSDIDETDGTCALRESGNAYTSVFGTENSALRRKTPFSGLKIP